MRRRKCVLGGYSFVCDGVRVVFQVSFLGCPCFRFIGAGCFVCFCSLCLRLLLFFLNCAIISWAFPRSGVAIHSL